MWYVIQVINGREDVMRERIEHVVPTGAMQELFYPQFQTEIKVHGEWVNTTKPLFPGYLICDTSDPRTVQQYLLRMDDFARVLQIPDKCVISAIMGSREVNTIGIHAKDLADKIPGAVQLDTFPEIAKYVTDHVEPGDLVLTLGCGDVYKVNQMMVKIMKDKEANAES